MMLYRVHINLPNVCLLQQNSMSLSAELPESHWDNHFDYIEVHVFE